jgi:hypothetical protein
MEAYAKNSDRVCGAIRCGAIKTAELRLPEVYPRFSPLCWARRGRRSGSAHGFADGTLPQTQR